MASKSDLPDFKSSQIKTLLSLTDEYSKILYSIYQSAEEIWSYTKIERFTDHSIPHSERILEFGLTIASHLKKQLTLEEQLWFSASSLLHDIGMQYGHYASKDHNTGYAEEDWTSTRDKHADRSVLMVKGLLGDEDALKKLIGAIATMSSIRPQLDKKGINIHGALHKISRMILAHTKDSYRRESGWLKLLKEDDNPSFRLKFLGALLRFTDELDVGSVRLTDYGMFRRNEIPLRSLEYWLASSFIDSVNILKMESALSISFDIDYDVIPSNEELADFCFYLINRQFKKIVRTLTKPIIPGYESIADIFLENGLSIRIEPIQIKKSGRLSTKEVSMDSKSIEAIRKVYKLMKDEGFYSDNINLEFFEVTECKNTKLVFVNEVGGFVIPSGFKKRIVDWVIGEGATKNTDYHCIFNRMKNSKNTLLEYLPDGSIAPHSILGVAATTMSMKNDIETIEILPSQIECNTKLKNNLVTVHFPKFSRPSSLSQAPITVMDNCDVIEVYYTPPGVSEDNSYKSVIYALITSLGNITFAIIPSDQQVRLNKMQEDSGVMPGAGVLTFFNGFEQRFFSNGTELETSESEERLERDWLRTREDLLQSISKEIKSQYGVHGVLISSIVGFLAEEKKYKVISWREKKAELTDHVHVGMIASSLPFIDNSYKEKMVGPPFCIHEEVFPQKKSIEVELWGGNSNNSYKILPNDNSLCIELHVNKSSEMKMKRFF